METCAAATVRAPAWDWYHHGVGGKQGYQGGWERGEEPRRLQSPLRKGWFRGARSAPTDAQELGLLPKLRVPFCSPADGIGKWGEKGELLFSGTYSSSYLCPLVVFGLRQLFFLPVSVTDASGIFPGHIHLAASSRC